MEFEILNEIMTGTVASLFTINRSSHLKFFKNSSQLNESKIDIPMGRGSTSNLLNDQLFGALATGTNGNATPGAGGMGSGINQQEWVNNQGRKFLEDAKERLQIDTRQYLFRALPLSQLNYDELNKVKRNVKGELKKYDQLFI